MGGEFGHIYLFFIYVCVLWHSKTSAPLCHSLAVPCRWGRRYQWEQLQAAGWMQLCCLPALRFIPDIRRYQSQELGSADMRKRVSHSTGNKGKAKSLIMQHTNTQKSHIRIWKQWQGFVFAEMERKEARGLEKHNSVPDAPPLLQFPMFFHSDAIN